MKRDELLPLARLIAGNVMAHTQGEEADPHWCLQVVDGLHDYLPEVQGALDGLEVAMEIGGWAFSREEESREHDT